MSKHSPTPLSAATPFGVGVLVLLLACLVLLSTAAPAAAAATTAATAPVAAGPVAPPAWLNTVNDDQTRMIQVGLFVVIIGIFLLTRSVK
jgi:hypothetical protein